MKKWNSLEDVKLIESYKKHGDKLNQISISFPGRSIAELQARIQYLQASQKESFETSPI